jgi:CelD/BcsL family acetyltransferase involved in cellulose biosynthesis
MSAWTSHLRQDWRPFLLALKSGYEIRGILPLMYRDERRRGLIPYRRVHFLGSEFTDYSLILAGNEDMAEVVATSLEWLFSGRFRWELMILDNLIEGNPAIVALKAWLEEQRIPHHIDKGKYYYIDLTRPWEEIWSEASKNFVRRNINLARNRITKAGLWKVVRDPDWDVGTIIAEASKMHITRQADLDRDSFYSDERHRNFLQRMIQIYREQRLFRSYWLDYENKYIAYMLGFEQNEIFYAWNMAFNSQFSHFFPSKLLLYEIIKDCFDRKLREFSFMRGETSYKAKWTQKTRMNYRFVINNTQSLYGKSLYLLERYSDRFQRRKPQFISKKS